MTVYHTSLLWPVFGRALSAPHAQMSNIRTCVGDTTASSRPVFAKQRTLDIFFRAGGSPARVEQDVAEEYRE